MPEAPRQFELSPEVAKLVLELADKTRQLAATIQADASMLEELAKVDLTEDLQKRMQTSEDLYDDLIGEIGHLQGQLKKLDKRFKKIFHS
jgi:hypothetical protein